MRYTKRKTPRYATRTVLFFSLYCSLHHFLVLGSHHRRLVSFAPGLSQLRDPELSRGTGWGFQRAEELDVFLTGDRKLGWWYNWGVKSSNQTLHWGVQHGVEFVPMQWSKWGISGLQEAIQPGMKHLLGYNEPNHKSQANLLPQEAAELWPLLEQAAQKHGLRLGAPAAAPCGAECVTPSPFDWYDQFFGNCTGCHFHFLPTHYYACEVSWLYWYLNECLRYGLPIWLTEWDCPNGERGSLQQQMTYMHDAVQMLDANANHIERYAWFAPRTEGWIGPTASLLNPKITALSQLGLQYLQPPVHTSSRQAILGKQQASQAVPAENATQASSSRWHLMGQWPIKSWRQLCQPCLDVHSMLGTPDLAQELQTLCGNCGFHVHARTGRFGSGYISDSLTTGPADDLLDDPEHQLQRQY